MSQQRTWKAPTYSARIRRESILARARSGSPILAIAEEEPLFHLPLPICIAPQTGSKTAASIHVWSMRITQERTGPQDRRQGPPVVTASALGRMALGELPSQPEICALRALERHRDSWVQRAPPRLCSLCRKPWIR
jgi:hypothetical protein